MLSGGGKRNQERNEKRKLKRVAAVRAVRRCRRVGPLRCRLACAVLVCVAGREGRCRGAIVSQRWRVVRWGEGSCGGSREAGACAARAAIG